MLFKEINKIHVPVLLNETINSLQCTLGGIYIDGTIGPGGHAIEIVKKIGPNGRLIGIDLDKEALNLSKLRFKKLNYQQNCIFFHGNYADVIKITKKLKIKKVDGILLDLGVSSHQLECGERGFSFKYNGFLDMRFDQTSNNKTAFDLINKLSKIELERIFKKFGEEKQANLIVSNIINHRIKKPIYNTFELSKIILDSVKNYNKKYKIHPATKIFQALRIIINDEILNLEKALNDGFNLLKKGGRFSVISFHSLEDRIVKNIFRFWESGCICSKKFPYCICKKQKQAKSFNKKVIKPNEAEIKSNPRSRSARLRSTIKVI